MIRINKRDVFAISMAYLFVPTTIFIIGWCRWYIALICLLSILFSAYHLYHSINREEKEVIAINKKAFCFILLFFIIIAYYLGWGRFTEQTNDFGKHNGVLNDLIFRPWPVIYSNIRGEHSMLTYYFGNYLVPALVGKLFSSYRIGEIMLGAWSLLGIILAYLNLYTIIKIDRPWKSILAAFTLIFFSCPFSVAAPLLTRLYDGFSPAGEWFWWSDDMKLQYSSNWCLLQWVMVQTISVWIAIPIFLRNIYNVKYYVPILLPILLSGAFAFLGIMPYTIIGLILLYHKEKKISSLLKQVFSVNNILFGGTVGCVFILFFIGNIQETKPEEIQFMILDYTDRKMLYVIFAFTMVIPYFFFIYHKFKNCLFFYTTLLMLLSLPFFSMGLMNDFMMRTSIPALYVLMILIISYICEFNWKVQSSIIRVLFVSLILTLSFSTRYPLRFLKEQIYLDDPSSLAYNKSYVTMEQFSDRCNENIRIDRMYNYFTYDLDNSIFYNYIAKKSEPHSNIKLVPVAPPDQNSD